MKKILLSSSLALSLLTVAPSAMALEVDINPSGFVDIIWTLSDGTDLGKFGEESRFNTTGELDVESKFKENVSMRFDADVNSSTAGDDSGRLEQIFLKWDIDPKLSLTGGVFNNKLGFEREDRPDMYQITHGQLWDIWNASTAEEGNNLQGVELSINFDKGNIFIGFLNDLNDTPEENSVEVAAQIMVSDNFDIVVGMITQDVNLETIFDIALSYRKDKLVLAGELLFADEQIDSGLMLMGNLRVSNKFTATARYDLVNYESTFLADDTSSLTIAGLYSISNNLFVNAEIRLNDNDNLPATPPPAATPQVGEGDGTTARLELLATF